MHLVFIVAGAIAFTTILIAVGAWGIVQIMDILESRDLRRETKARKLQEARKYLSNPEGYNQPVNSTTWVDKNSYTTGASTNMTWTNTVSS